MSLVGSSAILEKSRSAKSGRHLTCVSGLNGIARYIQVQRRFGHLPHTLILSVLLLASCGGNATAPSTPAPPNSVQTQVLNVTKTLADSINAAVKTAIQLRDQGQITPVDTATVERWAHSGDGLIDQIATEIGSADPWTTQKQKILLLLPGFQIPFRGPVNTTLQAALSAVTTTVNLIRAQVQ